MLRKNRKFKAGGSSGSFAASRTRWLVPGVAIGLLGFLGIVALCPLQERTVNAAEEMTLSAFLSPSITLSMSSSVSENIEPTVDGAFKNLATVARVQVMNSEYYDISISGNPDMVGTANPDSKISAVSGSKKASEFENNTWGYSASKNGAEVTTAVAADSNTTYAAMPSTNTAIVSRQSTANNAADDYYSLNFGAKVDTSIPADTYTSRVTVSVVASPVQATEYSLAYDSNGATGGTVPSKQMASSYEENYEFTVVGNTGNLTKTGYAFLGWADGASATTAQYTAGSKIVLSEANKNKTIYAVWLQNTNYSVTYFANGGTGTVPTMQTASNVDAVQTFVAAKNDSTSDQGDLTRSGYTFQGWAISEADANAGTVAYVAGATITLQQTTPTLELYAVWEIDGPYSDGTMQDLTPAACKAMATGTSKRLRDTRDNKVYWVTKMSDNNCWMTQNMDYEISGKSTSIGTGRGNSDGGYYWENGLKVMNTPNGTTVTTINDAWAASTDVDFYTKNGNSAVSMSTKTYDAHYLTGNYYQYSAAVAACNIPNWNLPTANQQNTVNGSFNKLFKDKATNTYSWIIAKPYFFTTSGRIDSSNGSQTKFGVEASYWSVTKRSSTVADSLFFSSSSVQPGSDWPFYCGFTVRCYVNGN